MRKKCKIIILIILILSMMVLNKVQAHSVEIDPNKLISMPWMIMNGSGEITIDESITNYELYYQAVLIDAEKYTEIENTETNGKEDIKKLKEEYKSLEENYNKAYDEYKAGLQNDQLSEDELNNLKSTYETAHASYKTKVNEYNSKIDEVNNKIKELTPTYVEANWIKTSDNKVQIDTTTYSGSRPYVVWVKLVTANETAYNEAIYTMSGTKSEEIDVTGISLNKTSISMKVGDTYTLNATITPSDATNKRIYWESEDEDIAEIEDGKITAISEGKTKIIATTDDGSYIATCEVVVNNSVPADTTEKNDPTTAKGILPNTGFSNVLIIAMTILAIFGFVFYKKDKNLNI